MTVIPCHRDDELRQRIERFAEALKTEAHRLGVHGLSENEFYNSGLFRGAIERIKGQYSATLSAKREFVQHILNYMEDRRFTSGWEASSHANRHDYSVRLPSGKVAVIDLKGCLDGNNTNIFERPQHADEFIIWSVCTNTAADPRHNVWSGIHTRLSAEIITREQRVDGLLVWDMVCGTVGRPCPKASANEQRSRLTEVGPFKVPPPCIYVFPTEIPRLSVPANAQAQSLDRVQLLAAFNNCFGGMPQEVNYVDFDVASRGDELVRKTTISRNGHVQKQSYETAIRRG
jgi:hypothetical protein